MLHYFRHRRHDAIVGRSRRHIPTFSCSRGRPRTTNTREDVQKGRNAMIALRAQVERADADTILVIHDDTS